MPHPFIHMDSRWRGKKNGEAVTLRVVFIYATGTKDKYQVNSYLLENENTGRSAEVAAATFEQSVRDKQLVVVPAE